MRGRIREVVIYFKFRKNRSRGLGAVGVENCPLPLTRPMAYTTACTSVQAVMRTDQVTDHCAFFVNIRCCQAVRHLSYVAGRTNTTAALNLLCTGVFQTSVGDRPSAANVAVLVANGESTLDAERVSTEAAACHDAGISIVVVAADSTLADSVELQSIASRPTTYNYFTVPTLSALSDLTEPLISAICPGCLLVS